MTNDEGLVYVGTLGWVPVDEAPPPDEGDSGSLEPNPDDHRGEDADGNPTLDAPPAAGMTLAGRAVVPFGRTLRLGSVGRDVVAVKRGLARSGHGSLKWAARSGRQFGPIMRRHVVAFQRQHHLEADGVYGLSTHRALAPFFDDYAVWLYTGQRPGSTPRSRIVAAALYFTGIRDRVHYTQGAARMSIVRNQLRPPISPATHVWEDCSSYVTGLYWIAGAPDPNGRGYDGFGFTGTLAEHGRPVSLVQARPGDLVFYGRRAPWSHVAVVLAPGRIDSHGSEPGPLVLDPHYRTDLGEVRSYLP